MGSVFSIAFLVPLLVGLSPSGNGAAPAAPLAVIIAAIGVLGLGWIVAEYTRKI
jgi:amino acid transporter